MVSYSDIRKLQKNSEQGYIPFYVYRPISAFFSVLFIKSKISANFITVLSLIADLLVIYFLYRNMWITAAIMINLALIFDLCDGEVARYNKSKQKSKSKKDFRYGGYLDETIGAIGFPLGVFFIGYFLGAMWIGLFAMVGLYLVIITSLASQAEFPNKNEIGRKFEQSIFGKIKGRIGFETGLQRILITLAILFQSVLILAIFGVLAHMFYILKYWVYRKY